MTPHEVWTSQCEVAREILTESGVEDALHYLIDGKFLNFLALAEDYPEWRGEIPDFVAEIRDIFGSWQIAEYLTTSCRPDALAHIGGGGAYASPGGRLSGEKASPPDVRDLALLQRATQLLSDDNA